jgi:hypothetical protein
MTQLTAFLSKKTTSSQLLLWLLCGLLSWQTATANQVLVSNVVLTGRDSIAGHTQVQFNLSWENSWRYGLTAGINNWDAVWLFVKFRYGAQDYRSAAGARNQGTTITVSTTAGLRVGMPVWVSSGTGSFPVNTVVASIINNTQFTTNVAPSTPLSGTAVVAASRIWEHAKLSNTGHQAGSGADVQLEPAFQDPQTAYNNSTNPAVGAFVYRTAEGYGNIALISTQLRWRYADNNLSNDAVVEVQVYAIEMTYVPQGAFFAGDGNETALAGQFKDAGSNLPLRITSESAIGLGGTSSGNLGNNNASGMGTPDDFNNSTTQSLPAAFPKGFAAIYAMKYEISQQQYVDFLNSLSRLQQENRTQTSLGAGTSSVSNRFVMSGSSSLVDRNGIRCDASIPTNGPVTFYCDLNANGTGGEATDGKWLAANWLSWADVAAYLDWAALRPMTELEFEKAGRGPRTPIDAEYSWGTGTILAAASITNSGAIDEKSGTAGSNAVFASGTSGPLRVGSFAVTNSSRTQASATEWGNTEFSGNAAERIISVGTASGRAFTATHGDGELQNSGTDAIAYGTANSSLWPAPTSNGHGIRGGAWDATLNDLRLSDRRMAADGAIGRSKSSGGRGVRSVGCSGPTQAVTINSGPTEITNKTATYTATGASSYWWVVPTGWEITSGQGTATITVYATQTGILRVASRNDCGSGPESSLTVFVN